MLTRRNVRRAALLVATALLVLSMPIGPADAAWPGRNGRIAIESDASGTRQIYARDLDGDDLVQLTGAGSNDDPSWSPDGRHLAFDSDGSNLTRLTRPPAGTRDSKPAWSPDGNSILSSSDSRTPGQFELSRLDTRTGSVRRLTHTPTGEYFSSWQPRPRDDDRQPDGD
jgi:Tol biopolymer transport system component